MCISVLLLKNCRIYSKNVAITFGLIGVVYRSIAVITISNNLFKLDDFDLDVYDIVLTTALSYWSLSLIANFFLLFGVYKDHPYFFLPYLSLEILEIVSLCIGVIVLACFLSMLELKPYLGLLIPLGLEFIAFNIYVWFYMVNLFMKMERYKNNNEV